MGYESIAHEAEGRMGYWLRGYEGERNNNICSRGGVWKLIQLVCFVGSDADQFFS